MAPSLVTPEKAARGKLPTDVWWHTIVPTERQGEDGLSHPEARGRAAPRSLQPSSRPGDWVLDFFAGSGTPWPPSPPTMQRRFVMVDSNPEAISVMRRRLGEDDGFLPPGDGAPLTTAYG